MNAEFVILNSETGGAVLMGASQFLAGQRGMVMPLLATRRTFSPSPRPSPSEGEGGASTPTRESAWSASSTRGLRGSLSQRERAGVRESGLESSITLRVTEKRPLPFSNRPYCSPSRDRRSVSAQSRTRV